MKPGEATEEVALKILHTADWHLGCRFRSFDEEDQKKLTRARLEAVERIFGLAESFSVNAVLCAGSKAGHTTTPTPSVRCSTGKQSLNCSA